MKSAPLYPLGPMVSIDVFRNDVIVHRQPVRGQGTIVEYTPEKRGSVTEFTSDSRARLAFVAANTDVCFKTMVTLTYPAIYPTDGKKVKTHLRAFLQWSRRRWGKPSYLWFLEFQKRGAPHIHIMLSCTRARADVPAVAEAWYHIVESGDHKHLLAGTRTEAVRAQDGRAWYALKYATKMYQKVVPLEYSNVGRLWGHSRDVAPSIVATTAIDDVSLREILATWRWAPDRDHPIYHTLYGASKKVVDVIGDYLDYPPKTE